MSIYAKGYCINGDGRPVENADNQKCATCNAEQRKLLRQASRVKVVTPIRKVTQKRAAQLREYAKLEKEYLECHPCCEVVECHRKSNQVHHMEGRANDNLLDVNLFLAVCPDCHRRITEDSAWAISQGYSILRSL